MRLNEVNNKVINVKGSISAIENELTQVDEKKVNAQKERESHIERLDGQIQKCREDIEAAEDKKSKGEKRLELLQQHHDGSKSRWPIWKSPTQRCWKRITR